MYYNKCQGTAIGPCRFSTVRLGERGFCKPPATKCSFCDETMLCDTTEHIGTELCRMYFVDRDLYRDALLRVPEDRRDECGKEARRQIFSAFPRGLSLVSFRRRLLLRATRVLMDDANLVPARVLALRRATKDLRGAASLRKIVPIALIGIASYNVDNFADEQAKQCAHAKQYGHNVRWHPAVSIRPVHDEEDLLENYMLARNHHQDILRNAEIALINYIRALELIRWTQREEQGRDIWLFVTSMLT